MNRINGQPACRYAALLILPAVMLGVLAMMGEGVSPALWGKQIAAWGVFALLLRPMKRAAEKIPAAVWSVLFLLFLAASLFGQSVGGARRWVNLIVFHANAAELILPALLAVLYRVACPYPVLIGAAFVLSFQPDISQLAAFGVAALVMLRKDKGNKIWRISTAALLGVLVIRCLSVPVVLEPVSYCEGILALLGDRSPLLWGAGWLALAAVPAYFARQFFLQGETAMLSLSAYYTVCFLFSVSGAYPVLLMGFGLSPIVGYYLAHVFCGADQ